MNVRTSLRVLACCGMLLPARVAAQFPDDPAQDRARIAELLGTPAPRDSARRGLQVNARAQLAWNSELPYSLNDGPMWAGRGLNVSLTPMVTWRAGSPALAVTATIAPTLVHSANAPFFIFPYPGEDRSSFASPWHLGAASADLPLRFGNEGFTTIDPGFSAITVASRWVAAGASTAPEWWGPAIRNTLVLSSNAPGIPRVFLRTAQPLRSRAGALEAQLIAGTLTESRFFDDNAGNDYRSVSGLRVAFRPAFDTSLTLGASRVVYGPASGAGAFAGRALDALTWWKPMATPADTLASGASKQERDQLASLFMRWVFPQVGAEIYGEWARMELPRSMHEFLEAPQHTQAYTVGMQWARRIAARNGTVRVQGEFSDLGQNQVFRDRPIPDFYTGRATAHGWTQRGQPLGAAIGPGANSQWLASDWLADAWQAGAFVGRVRWENDAMYRQVFPRMTRHDVSLLAGTRGALRARYGDVGGSLTVQRRLNYLFQNEAFNAGEPGNRVDVTNVTLTLSLTPR